MITTSTLTCSLPEAHTEDTQELKPTVQETTVATNRRPGPTVSMHRPAGIVEVLTLPVHALPHGATPANHVKNSTPPKFEKHTSYPYTDIIATGAVVAVVAEVVAEDAAERAERVAEVVAEVSQRE